MKEFNLNENSSELNFYNNEEMFHHSITSYVNSITFIVSVIFIFGIIFNLISIVAILKSKNFEPINLLILNLALADLIYIGGIPLFVVHVFSQSWPFKLIGCQLFFLTDFMGMIVGVYTVAALSVERYFEVADKKKRLEKLSNNFKLLIVLVYLILLWFLGFFFSLPIVFSIELYQTNKDSFACETKWDENKINTLFFIKFIFIFFIPFSIISYSSVKLLFFLKNSRRDSIIHLSVKNTRHGSQISALNFFVKSENKKSIILTGVNVAVRQKAIKIVLSIVFLFFLQWIPLWIGEVYKASSYQIKEYIQLLNILATLLSYSNSISNPLLYIFLTHKFPMIHNIWKHLNDLKKNLLNSSGPTLI